MPHLILEYTNNMEQNLEQKIFAREIFPKLHQILADTGINKNNCKSRAIALENYYIGQGEKQNAFVHLEIRILAGRSLELKQEIASQSIGVLEKFFATLLCEWKLQITVEIKEIEKKVYYKFPPLAKT